MIVYGMIGLAILPIIFGIGLKRTLTSPEPSVARATAEFLLCTFSICLFFALRLSFHVIIVCLFSLSFHYCFCLSHSVSIAVKEVSCVVHNETTLEKTVNYRIRSVDPSFVNPYDLGLFRNFTQVFSTSPIYWILPLPLPFGHDDGLHFDTRPTLSSSQSS